MTIEPKFSQHFGGSGPVLNRPTHPERYRRFHLLVVRVHAGWHRMQALTIAATGEFVINFINEENAAAMDATAAEVATVVYMHFSEGIFTDDNHIHIDKYRPVGGLVGHNYALIDDLFGV